MNFLRILLFPFAVLYGLITSIRNFLFDKEILKATSFPVPVIAVGNLSVGGTGKTPQIEYLIRLLSENYKVATLSRGYKRKSKGFVLADKNSNAEILGDEPYQYFQKFPQIQVAVDADRTNGIQQLLKSENPPQVILLDDAFQHRKVKADLYILLTTFNDLYCDDFVLPTGNLRESRSGANRAKIVIVTKCPETLSIEEQAKIQARLNVTPDQKLFFTTIRYDHLVYSKCKEISIFDIHKRNKVLLAGIAKPEPFFHFLKNTQDLILTFPDHHQFSESEIDAIKSKANQKIIITTEKDYVRIKDEFSPEQLYYLPIQTAFLDNKELFAQLIKEFINDFVPN